MSFQVQVGIAEGEEFQTDINTARDTVFQAEVNNMHPDEILNLIESWCGKSLENFASKTVSHLGETFK